MAREMNGDVRAAYLNFESAAAGARSAAAAFLPTITPSYQYDFGRTQFHTGGFANQKTDEETGLIDVSWTLLDNGTRNFRFEASKQNREATAFQALQTLRSTLFSVHQGYYDALRSQELLRVQEAQLARAQEIERQAEVFADPAVGAGARIDILQARADRLNAATTVLRAENQVATTSADLKAILGWPERDDLPNLERPETTADPQPLAVTMDEAFELGVRQRADLEAARLRIEAQRYDIRLARASAGVTYTVDANYRRGFAEDVFDSTGLQFRASLPVFDGRRSRELVRIEELALESLQAQLTQSERDARAEIESAYKEASFNLQRLDAARVALEAAQENYTAAVDRRTLGAGTLIEILTAQVTLVTAESNFVEAFYDALIGEVRLRLAMGSPLPGEPTP